MAACALFLPLSFTCKSFVLEMATVATVFQDKRLDCCQVWSQSPQLEPLGEPSWDNHDNLHTPGSASCLDLLNISFVIQTFIASHYFSGTSERVWVLFLFVYLFILKYQWIIVLMVLKRTTLLYTTVDLL